MPVGEHRTTDEEALAHADRCERLEAEIDELTRERDFYHDGWRKLLGMSYAPEAFAELLIAGIYEEFREANS